MAVSLPNDLKPSSATSSLRLALIRQRIFGYRFDFEADPTLPNFTAVVRAQFWGRTTH